MDPRKPVQQVDWDISLQVYCILSAGIIKGSNAEIVSEVTLQKELERIQFWITWKNFNFGYNLCKAFVKGLCKSSSPVFFLILLEKCICYDVSRLLLCLFYSLVFYCFLKLSRVFRKSLHSFQYPWDFNGLSKNYRKFSIVSKFWKFFWLGYFRLSDDCIVNFIIHWRQSFFVVFDLKIYENLFKLYCYGI